MSLLFFLEYYLGFIARLFMRNRYEFEKKNLSDSGAQSFRQSHQKADIAVEFSSEGEFQRVKYLLKELLQDPNYKIECIFCSPSVEKAVITFQKQYSEQIRFLRLTTLLRGENHLSSWITASKLLMVSYDFFPQLLNLRSRMKEMILIAPELESIGYYKKYCLSFFDTFLLDLESDKEKLSFLKTTNIYVGNLRVLEIKKRIKKARETLFENLLWFEKFLDKLKSSERKIILGNYWHDEYELMDLPKVNSNDILVIVPHQLNEKQNENILKSFENISFVTKEQEPDLSKNVFLFSLKGVLCELYQFFDIAYIGGGYRKSVHSLLEPYLSGCFCICGPKTSKSNEFSYIAVHDKDRLGQSLLRSLDKKSIGQRQVKDDWFDDFLTHLKV